MLTQSLKLSQSVLTRALTDSVKQLVTKQLVLEDAPKCMALQSTLTKLELHAYGQRSLDDYKAMIQSGIMVGLCRPDGKLVAQIGSNLGHKKKSYIISENPVVSELLDKSVVLEQGAYIVHRDYRGQGLQSKLELSLSERIKALIEDGEKLKIHNAELHNSLSKVQTSLIVSGCSSENPASALTSLKSGSMLVGVKDGIVVNEGEEELTAYALAKPLTGIGRIIYDESTETRTRIGELLEEREQLEKIQNEQIRELQERGKMLIEDTSDLRSNEEKLKEIESLQKLRANPLPKSWVAKVTKAGYVISKDSEGYHLHKPIAVERV